MSDQSLQQLLTTNFGLQPSGYTGSQGVIGYTGSAASGTGIGTLCRAWVNFDGSATPPSIRSSFNVSSVTRSATGQYVVTLTNALDDANGCVTGTARILGVGGGYASPYMDTSSTIQVNSHNTAGSLINANQISIAVFR